MQTLESGPLESKLIEEVWSLYLQRTDHVYKDASRACPANYRP